MEYFCTCVMPLPYIVRTRSRWTMDELTADSNQKLVSTLTCKSLCSLNFAAGRRYRAAYIVCLSHAIVYGLLVWTHSSPLQSSFVNMSTRNALLQCPVVRWAYRESERDLGMYCLTTMLVWSLGPDLCCLFRERWCIYIKLYSATYGGYMIKCHCSTATVQSMGPCSAVLDRLRLYVVDRGHRSRVIRCMAVHCRRCTGRRLEYSVASTCRTGSRTLRSA